MLRRLLLITVSLVLILFIVAAGAAYWFFSRDGFRRALEAQASAWLGHPVRIGAAHAQFLPRLAIQLEDIRVGDPAQLTLAEVDLAADLRPLIARRIENADVLVSDSRIDMPLPLGLPTAAKATAHRPGSNNTSENPTSDGAVRIVSVRSIALRSVRIQSRGREVVVSADSALAGDVLTLQRFTAEAGGTTLSAEGVIALAPRVDARLKATANRLDVDEMIALVDAFSPRSPGGARNASARQPVKVTATVSAEQATAGGLQARNFSTQLSLDGDALTLNPLRFEMFGGRYDGSLTARLGQQLSGTLESRIADIDVAQLAAFGRSEGTVTGRLSGEGTFRGSGVDIGQLLRDASGNGKASVVDGSIRRLNLVRTVVLFFGRPAPDAGESTDRFDRLDVEFSLARRIVHADPFSLNSADADMMGAGTLNLETDALDGRVDLRLSEALSAQAGTDLYRYTREGKRVVLPAVIGGTLSMPRLRIDVAAAAKRGLRNEIERRIQDLFKGPDR